MREVLCANCRDFVNFSVNEKLRTETINGIELSFKQKIAYCNDCKEEIYVGSINDYNIDRLEEAYIKAKSK